VLTVKASLLPSSKRIWNSHYIAVIRRRLLCYNLSHTFFFLSPRLSHQPHMRARTHTNRRARSLKYYDLMITRVYQCWVKVKVVSTDWRKLPEEMLDLLQNGKVVSVVNQLSTTPWRCMVKWIYRPTLFFRIVWKCVVSLTQRLLNPSGESHRDALCRKLDGQLMDRYTCIEWNIKFTPLFKLNLSLKKSDVQSTVTYTVLKYKHMGLSYFINMMMMK
jgi:hypothetical protein